MVRAFLVALFLLLMAFSGGAAPSPATFPAQYSFPNDTLEQVAHSSAAPRNVILFIGDGMGPVHVQAASLYLGRPLLFESFDHRGAMTTYSMNGITDSAAGATAIATGRRVNNRVISLALPGDGQPLPTVLEQWQARGARTGLATTSEISDATPAAFAAHERTRDNDVQIALDYFQETRPNVLLGGGGPGVTEELAEDAGYTVVTNASQMLGLDADHVTHVSGQFGDDKLPPINHGREPYPTLAQMTVTALDILEEGPDGFFLLVEQEGTDSYSHRNELGLVVDALIELEEAVEVAVEWAADESETLIVLTADHETGGLAIRADNGEGELPAVRWSSGSGHTSVSVPIYARGPRAQLIALVGNNTELTLLLSPGPRESETAGGN